MSEHHYEEGGVIKSFTLTAFLSFAIIFCLLILLSTCHGPFKGYGAHEGTSVEKTEGHSEHH